MRRHFRHCSSNCLPIILLLPLTLLPFTLLPLTPATAQSMGGNGLDAYGYDSGGTYHGSNYGSSPNYMVSGPSDADMAKLQSQLQNDFAFLNHHNDPPPRRWSDDNDYTPPPPPPPHVPSYMEKMQSRADAGDKEALRYLADDIVLWDRGDYARAVNFYQKAIDAGDQSSMEPLYHLLLDKKRGVEDIPRATKLLPALSEHGIDFQDIYGRALIAGDGFPKDAVHGLELREAAATKEDVWGTWSIMYDLARDYDTGNGIAPNPERALYWYKKTAWGGYDSAGGGQRSIAASKVCATMLAQKDGLRTYRDDFVALLTSFGSALPWPDRQKLTSEIAKVLVPGEEDPGYPATGAGLLLMTKSFGTPNYAEAIKHFTSSQNVSPEDHPNTDLVAVHQLGLIYEQGLGVPRDHDKAMEFFEKVNGNYGDASYYHSVEALRKWQASKQSATESGDTWAAGDSQRAAAEGARLGDVRAKNLSAQWIERSTSLNQSLTPEEKTAEFQKANKLWKEASAAGDAQAAYFLGTTAEAGEGMPKDLVAATKFYRQASDAGDPEAQERYAWYMITGKGSVPKDAAGGQALLEKAAENSPQAANELAVLLWHSPDPKSHGAAIKKLLLKSFGDGFWVAGRNLAKYYHVGLGGIKDETQARDYLEKAAKRGGKDGAKVAMDAYTKGDCVNANPAAAARWKAAAAGL